MNKRAWKVEPELIDRFLEVLADDGYEWASGQWANQFKPMCSYGDTTLFIEELPKTIMYLRYSYYPDKSDEEYNITEVTEELLEVMESEGVTSAVVHERCSKDLWKLVCGEEECESDTDNTHDPVNHPDHYNRSGIETIKIIEMCLTEEEYRGFLKGNILKYRERAPYKGNAEEDYAKAKWYFDELLEIGF